MTGRLRSRVAEGTVRVAATARHHARAQARLKVATAQDAEVQMLLASVMNWQPGGGHSMFGNLFGSGGIPGLGNSATPSSALSFGPGLLGLLSDAKDGTS